MRKKKIEYPLRKGVFCSTKEAIVNKIAIPYFVMKFDINELGLWVRLKMTGDMFGFVFDQIFKLYTEKGLSDQDAMKRAKENLDMFYKACSDLSANNRPPMSATVHTKESKKNLFLSFNENENGKRLQENDSDS